MCIYTKYTMYITYVVHVLIHILNPLSLFFQDNHKNDAFPKQILQRHSEVSLTATKETVSLPLTVEGTFYV